ncbi:hypothetical protein [Microbacterium elymi]|uniref:Uncharacterized protein n=1 Tax=Microbacterium elymi TaxID=2909587 RepID=A0ABY5NLQ8_9MICO|nr:hypothetical protein [Microbacterium elymi]UUT36124.1 hypothetical protein L2X98_23960 [Microbacterium elymi]
MADAIGWLRVLSGAPLRLRSSEATERGALALLDAGDAVATLTVTSLTAVDTRHPDRGRISAAAFGTVRTDVAIGVDSSARVLIDDGAGARMTPTRWESRLRLALRRAIDALDRAESVRDLDDLEHDLTRAELICHRPPGT